MRAVVGSLESGHAIETGKICAAALVAMRVELLLGKHVATSLCGKYQWLFRQIVGRAQTCLALEGDHRFTPAKW